MNLAIRFRILLICLCLSYCNILSAQPQISIYSDIGKNNTAKSSFLRSAALGQYQFGKNLLETGFQMEIKSTSENVFSGYRFVFSREVDIHRNPVKIQGFLIQTSYTNLLREFNWGAGLNMTKNRFDLTVGTNFRIYAFKKEAILTYHIERDAQRLIEPFNLMYSLTYHIKIPVENLDLGLTVTNTDYFKITQETNPLFRLNALYQLNKSVSLTSQLWYEPAGIFNIYANYFGTFFRAGIIWNL